VLKERTTKFSVVSWTSEKLLNLHIVLHEKIWERMEKMGITFITESSKKVHTDFMKTLR
jgi:hypothetical protein